MSKISVSALLVTVWFAFIVWLVTFFLNEPTLNTFLGPFIFMGILVVSATKEWFKTWFNEYKKEGN